MNGIGLALIGAVLWLTAYQLYDDNRRHKAIKKIYANSVMRLLSVAQRLREDEARMNELTDELQEIKNSIRALENASRRNKTSLANLEIGTQKRIKKLARAKAIGKRRRRKA